MTFEANLDGLQVVPPHVTPAFGFADATLDTSTDLFSITTGNYNDLLGNSTTVLLRDAAVGSNGPSILTLTLDSPGTATSTFSGSGTLTPTQVTDLTAGNVYVQITSNVFPSGEIRGQFEAVATPEPGSIAA
jgi:hypothetical protein